MTHTVTIGDARLQYIHRPMWHSRVFRVGDPVFLTRKYPESTEVHLGVITRLIPHPDSPSYTVTCIYAPYPGGSLLMRDVTIGPNDSDCTIAHVDDCTVIWGTPTLRAAVNTARAHIHKIRDSFTECEHFIRERRHLC